MRTYGTPGGLYASYELEFDYDPGGEKYVVRNEGGDDVAAYDSEREAQRHCEDLTAGVDEWRARHPGWQCPHCGADRGDGYCQDCTDDRDE